MCVCVCFRLEMSAELQRQKELENLHQRQQLEHLVASLPPDHPALRSLPDLPEGHPLREELLRQTNAMLVLRHGAATPLLAIHQQQGGGGVSATSKDGQQQSSAHSSSSSSSSTTAGLDAHSSRKSPASRQGPQAQLCGGDQSAGDDRGRESDSEEEMKESDSEAELYEERRDRKSREKERRASRDSKTAAGCNAKEAGDRSGRESAPSSSAEASLAKAEVKYQLPSSLMPPLPGLHAQALPFGFPYASPYFHTGESSHRTHSNKTRKSRWKDRWSRASDPAMTPP